MSQLAIVGGTVIDGNGGPPLENGVILIEEGRIRAVADRTTEISPRAEKIEALGHYIIPGLMDANVHLFFTIAPDHLVRHRDRYEEVVSHAAQIALKHGVTSVFDTWGPRAALTRVRDHINGGRLIGSRIFFAGNIIGLGGPTSPDFFPQARSILGKHEADAIDACWEQGVGADLLWMTPAEVRARVRAYIRERRPDFLKYASSGHIHMQLLAFAAEIQCAIVEEGHDAGLTVQAHTTSPESLRLAIEAGCDLIQHGDITGPVLMPEETLRLMIQKPVPCAAMFTTRRYRSWSETQGCEPMKTYRRVQAENDRRLVAAQAPILLTTDAGHLPPDAADHPLMGAALSADDSPTVLGEAHFRWLEAAAELGMKPMHALMAATRNIARAYQVDRDLGTLEPGKIADLLVLEKNPLENPAHYRSICLIVKDGKVIDRDALPGPQMRSERSTTQATGG